MITFPGCIYHFAVTATHTGCIWFLTRLRSPHRTFCGCPHRFDVLTGYLVTVYNLRPAFLPLLRSPTHGFLPVAYGLYTQLFCLPGSCCPHTRHVTFTHRLLPALHDTRITGSYPLYAIYTFSLINVLCLFLDTAGLVSHLPLRAFNGPFRLFPLLVTWRRFTILLHITHFHVPHGCHIPICGPLPPPPTPDVVRGYRVTFVTTFTPTYVGRSCPDCGSTFRFPTPTRCSRDDPSVVPLLLTLNTRPFAHPPDAVDCGWVTVDPLRSRLTFPRLPNITVVERLPVLLDVTFTNEFRQRCGYHPTFRLLWLLLPGFPDTTLLFDVVTFVCYYLFPPLARLRFSVNDLPN